MNVVKAHNGDLAADLSNTMRTLGRAAREAAAQLALTDRATKDQALKEMAAELRARSADILAANGQDMKDAKAKGLTAALLDRLMLDQKRVEAMATGLEEIAELPDPVGRTLAEWTRPNGLEIARVSVPLGVIGIIYESRPNVTADASGLCLKSGNAAILRGGSESARSSAAIVACLQAGLRSAGLPAEAIQMVPTSDRAAVGILLSMHDLVDVIVPRGGKGLIERVAAESRIPVIMHLDGNCHTYVDGDADAEKARRIVLNAKMRRTGICGATETLLVDSRAKALIPTLIDDLIKAGCEVRGDSAFQAADTRVKPATDADWDTEYLDAIIAARVVDGVGQAIRHINRYGSRHTEAIVTENKAAAERFLREIDAGILMWNTSTQFADGGEFGMGAEIGISTGKLHARGPVGCEQLTSYKYIVRGTGQVRA
ncbi:glutamate-5-semialdehyde dehydrogenase [Dongia deserti]|uniref:glutamate-5-semialdehyde dehydrogenase n=1 Tax=Dongia deserti TaxID=2268030 RepID=UPI00389949CD